MMTHDATVAAMRAIRAGAPVVTAPDVADTVEAWGSALVGGPSRDWDESDIYLTSEMMDEMEEWDINRIWPE